MRQKRSSERRPGPADPHSPAYRPTHQARNYYIHLRMYVIISPHQAQYREHQRALHRQKTKIYAASVDSTAQKGNTSADWQEEVYQKIKDMKEAYFTELHVLHQRLVQEYDEVRPHKKKPDYYEKLKNFKLTLESLMMLLCISKNNVSLGLKEKIPAYEQQIVRMLSSQRRPEVMPSELKGQLQLQQPGRHTHVTPHQQPSQVLQVQQHENHSNQVQQMTMPCSFTYLQPTAMQHEPITLPAPSAQQDVNNSLHSSACFDPVQINSLSSLRQGLFGSVQQSGLEFLQNSTTAAQQITSNSVSQSYMNALQYNVNSFQKFNVLQQQDLKQKQQEHMQNQQLKRQLQQCQMQKQFLQQRQWQQHLQTQKPEQQLQLAPQAPVHIPQLQPMNDLTDLKTRKGSGTKSEPCQLHHHGGQHPNYYYQQLKPAAAFLISSRQNLQSPYSFHQSSSQIDQFARLPSLTKSMPPSTPIVPSPIPEDAEKQLSGAILLQNEGQTRHQETFSTTPQAQTLSVAAPGISPCSLLAEYTNLEEDQPSMLSNSRRRASERTIDSVVEVVQLLKPKALSSAVSDITSVLAMINSMAGSEADNGPRAAVHEDLVAMKKSHSQSRNFRLQDVGPTTKKLKTDKATMPLDNVPSAGSTNYLAKSGFMMTSCVRRNKIEVNNALEEEIREINQKLFDIMVSLGDEDSDSFAAIKEVKGTIVKFSFCAVSLNYYLKAHFASVHMIPIEPLRLLVPANYPKCSPLIMGKFLNEPSKVPEDLSMKAKLRFSRSLQDLSQPMSLGKMAIMWEACVREVIVDYAKQRGGGTFSSFYGTWQKL